jgi:Phage terminase, small subunit
MASNVGGGMSTRSEAAQTPPEPEFEGQRPPFEAENTVATKHAAYSPRQLAPLTREITAEIRELVPDAADAAAVEILASNLARIRAANQWLDERGLFRGDSSEGIPQPVLSDLRTWERTALNACERLGLTRSSRATLGLTAAGTDVLVEAARVAAILPRAIPELVLGMFDFVDPEQRDAAKAFVDTWVGRYRNQLALPPGDTELERAQLPAGAAR